MQVSSVGAAAALLRSWHGLALSWTHLLLPVGGYAMHDGLMAPLQRLQLGALLHRQLRPQHARLPLLAALHLALQAAHARCMVDLGLQETCTAQKAETGEA